MSFRDDGSFMKEPMDDLGLIKLSGSIEHVIYSNEENGYAICDLGTDADELITITGTLPYIGEGDVVTVYGSTIPNTADNLRWSNPKSSCPPIKRRSCGIFPPAPSRGSVPKPPNGWWMNLGKKPLM